jgi:hypothetical protein
MNQIALGAALKVGGVSLLVAVAWSIIAVCLPSGWHG